jgi:hypothetical protein
VYVSPPSSVVPESRFQNGSRESMAEKGKMYRAKSTFSERTAKAVHHIENQLQQCREAWMASHPSLTMSGTRAKAAIGSAHGEWKMALANSPAKAISDK